LRIIRKIYGMGDIQATRYKLQAARHKSHAIKAKLKFEMIGCPYSLIKK
jgi:hypothetical protein